MSVCLRENLAPLMGWRHGQLAPSGPVLASHTRDTSLCSVNKHVGSKVLMCYSFKYHIDCQS